MARLYIETPWSYESDSWVDVTSVEFKARFPLQPYRTETWRIPLSCELSGRTYDFRTKENATFRYGTVGVENGLNNKIMHEDKIFDRQNILQFFSGVFKDYKYVRPGLDAELFMSRTQCKLGKFFV